MEKQIFIDCEAHLKTKMCFERSFLFSVRMKIIKFPFFKKKLKELNEWYSTFDSFASSFQRFFLC